MLTENLQTVAAFARIDKLSLQIYGIFFEVEKLGKSSAIVQFLKIFLVKET